MNSIKLITVVLIITFFFMPIAAEKRPPKKTIEELTDPKSPSYVPYPYPKNNKEIIADLKYYVKEYCECDYEANVDGTAADITDIMLSKLFEPNSEYTIDKIMKVKNRIAGFSDNYTWLIMIMDKDGNYSMRVALLANGLFAQCGAVSENSLKKSSPKQVTNLKRLMKSLDLDDFKNILSTSLDRSLNNNDIKKIERIAYPTHIGDLLTPICKITMTDGSNYYYSEVRDMLYSIEKRIPWKKNKKGYRPSRSSLVPNQDHLPDSIDDELLVLKNIPKKK